MLPWRPDADHDEVLAVEERIAANFAKQTDHCLEMTSEP
jgi:hypothetical protein